MVAQLRGSWRVMAEQDRMGQDRLGPGWAVAQGREGRNRQVEYLLTATVLGQGLCSFLLRDATHSSNLPQQKERLGEPCAAVCSRVHLHAAASSCVHLCAPVCSRVQLYAAQACAAV